MRDLENREVAEARRFEISKRSQTHIIGVCDLELIHMSECGNCPSIIVHQVDLVGTTFILGRADTSLAQDAASRQLDSNSIRRVSCGPQLTCVKDPNLPG